ncbi:MAG TPA: hypothetical protein VF221_03875 [Chloroflexota bacterium]
MAARLEGLSTGGDVVITDAIHDDPEILELLAGVGGNFIAERFLATLKGFDEATRLWRISWAPRMPQEESSSHGVREGLGQVPT